MIFGKVETPVGSGPARDRWTEAWGGAPEARFGAWDDAAVSVSLAPSGAAALDEGHFVHHDEASGVRVALSGQLFNLPELAGRWGQDRRREPGAVLAAGYERLGAAFLAELNGSFALVLHDPRQERVWIARDHLGIEPLYYRRLGDSLHFSSELRRLARLPGAEAELDPTALLRYLLLNYNPGFDTLFRGVRKLRPGHLLRVEGERVEVEPYWRLSFRDSFVKSREEYREELRDLLRDAVRIRLGRPDQRAGAYLSGGMDSSSVVCLMAGELGAPVSTFSFRCSGRSFDESGYARAVSRHCRTEHHEVPYEAADAAEVVNLVPRFQEPFADIGIEVATYLLALRASGRVDYVMTGDGGDELFAGHPVYAADPIAARFDALPAMVRRPITALLQRLPDSREKKSLRVKAQRLAYSLEFSPALHSNRWRIYYKRPELEGLLTGDWRPHLDGPEPLQPLLAIYDEADGADPLSRNLYGDYHTVVDFYLRRMEVVRQLGFSARFPLLDPRLVEYAARIPSELKITSDAATKFLLQQAMAEVLPREVLERKDKLGNSVPLKNWMRERPELHALMGEYLSPEAVRARGIFEPAVVERLRRRHLSGWENNSHRLWSLLALELWCRHHLDAREALV